MRNDSRLRSRLGVFATAMAAVLILVPAANAQWATSGANINNTNTGNVGIGTTTPSTKLDVGGWTGIPGDIFGALVNFGGIAGGDAFFGNTGTSVGRMRVASNANEGFFQWNMYYNGTGLKSMDNTKPGYELTMNAVADTFTFVHYPAGSGFLAPSTLVTITGSGSVGIGTTTPAVALDVVGAIHASAGIAAVYQDVAEWVPATEKMSPGTVVVLNPDEPNEVMPSTRPYDTTVAGVVSETPGIVLGKPSDNKAQIATTGRVRVRVDASKLPVRIGDLLVTGRTPGMAMRSQPLEVNGHKFHQPGTIIGKALEPLPSGQGEILVLLSLQ